MSRELIAIYQEKGVILDYDYTENEQQYEGADLIKQFVSDDSGGYKALFYFGFEPKKTSMHQSVAFLHDITTRFIRTLSRNPDIEFTRRGPEASDDELLAILHDVPFVYGIEHISFKWIKDFWQELAKVFNAELAMFNGTVADFLTAHDSSINIAGRVFFHLVESKADDYPFAFLSTYSTNAGNRRAKHLPLKNALAEYKGNDDMILQLLSAVSKAADKSTFISDLVESGELFSPLKFTADEAYTFLQEIPLYEECGIMCRMPDWWRKKNNGLRTLVTVGEKQPSAIGLDTLLSFDPSIFLGDEQLTREELEALLAEAEGLAFLKGKWVEIDHEKLRAVLDIYEKAGNLAEKGGLTLAETMRMQLGIGKGTLDDKTKAIEISNGEWLTSAINKMLNPEKVKNLSVGKNFKAHLRHYQQKGFNWLAMMQSLGFGALLADDMGLGKTVQILALLEYIRQNANFKTLLIIPASLIGNWKNEIEKFAPKLNYSILHSKNTELDINSANLFITTYGMAMRMENLRDIKWDAVILDEAQAIKNPGTKQTKAVKQIPSTHRIAITGTPVENRLSDLWSIFDFLNTGLLGTHKEFSDFAKRIGEHDSYSRLRQIINPFILRRLKTDKAVINDLPDKIEIKDYASLNKKQIALYNELVKMLERSLEETDGIARKGLVLASIMKFKQICNHPDQYLGQGGFDEKASGKFELLGEICETIREKRERVLIFTQFKEMTEPLADYLTNIFEREGLILHGGTTVQKRATLVDKFNDAEYVPFMVLSLKAGGVGLNLTAANHVIHFDRWWNPAIENQATDRAFRIGQTKNVMVHKFITKGTIEEKIDLMIEQKQKLASELIAASGEAWMTKLSNDELLSLFRL
jgi:non-specific serine/threonine protein kinase